MSNHREHFLVSRVPNLYGMLGEAVEVEKCIIDLKQGVGLADCISIIGKIFIYLFEYVTFPLVFDHLLVFLKV